MRDKIKYLGKEVKIFEFAKIIKPESLEIDDYSQIDDFVFLNSGIETKIGKFVHISSFSSIIGGGKFTIGDFSGLSAGCRIITGSDDFKGSYLSNPCIPNHYKNVQLGEIRIGKHCILGSNCVVLPNILIPDGVSVGAGSIISKDLEPWSIYVGYKPKKVAERTLEGFIDLEAKLKKELGIN